MKRFFLTTTGIFLWAGAAIAGPPTGAEAQACGAFPSDGGQLDCSCSGTEEGSVWGSGPYTSDSNVCVAARHAGVIGLGGGVVSPYGLGGQEAYPGSNQNGVQTSTWGSYGASFDFPRSASESGADMSGQACGSFPSGGAPYSCVCSGQENGSVWGSGPYTSDSDLCVAARHAGAIGPRGGAITALAADGLDSYAGSEANGVTTHDWGSYGSSVIFGQK